MKLQSIFCTLLMLHIFASGSMRAQNSWLPTPLASMIDGMAINNQGHLFAHGYQLFRSTDSGISWTAIGSGIANEAVFKPIGIAGNGDIFVGRWRSVWRSQDNGDTWQKIDTTMGDVHSFAFGNNDEIFAASTVRGIYKSTDGGDSWHQTTTTNGISIVIDSNGKLYANMVNSVYSSTDKGVTWIRAGNAPNPDCLAVNPFGHIFAGTFSNGMFRSTDGGVNWIPINYGSNMSRIDGFAFDTLGHVFAYYGTVCRSTDNGDSWTEIKRGLPGTIIRSILSAQSLFVGTLSNGVFRRNEIVTWAPLPPIQSAPPNASTDIPVNPILRWNSSEHAGSYALFVARDPTFSQVVYSNGNINDTSVQVFGLPYTTTLYWRLRGTHPEEGTGGWSYTWTFTTTYPLLAPPILVSPMNGEASTVINPRLVWKRVTSSMAYSVQIASDPDFNSIVYENLNVNDTTVRSTALQYNTEYFWRTRTIRTDSTSIWSLPWSFTTIGYAPLTRFPLAMGNSWTIAVYRPILDLNYYQLKQVEKDTILADGKHYAAIRNYTRPPNGTTWTPGSWDYMRVEGSRVYMFPDLELVDFDSTVGSCFYNGCIFYDTREGRFGKGFRILYLGSFNYWSYTDSIGFDIIHATQEQNYYPAETIGARINGVEYGNAMAVEEHPIDSQPSSFLLYQNYPNPFNPTTTIGFRVASSGFVSLKVFDLLGREVATLVNEEMQPGSYERVFHAKGLASGVYLYRLQAGSFVQTRKLLLLK